MNNSTQPSLLNKSDQKNNLQYALEYARRGLHVFPVHSIKNGVCTCRNDYCSSQGKHPLTSNGCKDGTTDEKSIIEWWTTNPNANIGICTGEKSGFVVLDIDTKNDGFSSLDKLETEFGKLPTTPTVETGGGGLHYLFKCSNEKIGNRTNLYKGIDVRGDGGYIVAPPSTHISGNQYRWKDILSPNNIELADIPDWLLPMIQKPEEAIREVEDIAIDSSLGNQLQAAQMYAAKAEGVSEGSRNQSAFSLAGNLHAFSISEESVLELIRKWNKKNTPPLSYPELKRTVHSAKVNGTPRENKQPRSQLGHCDENDPNSDNWKDVQRFEGQTDIANARRFKELYHDSICYCLPINSWLIWDGIRWKRDKELMIERQAKVISDNLWNHLRSTGSENSSALRFAARTASANGVRQMLQLAKSEMSISPCDLDQNIWQMNFNNGTLDLKTGNLREHKQTDYITKLCPFDYLPIGEADTSLYDRFMKEIFNNDVELITYVNALLGYCLTGSTQEHILPIFHGSGSNGKSTLLEAVMYAIGTDYCMKAPHDFLMATKGDRHPTDIADLCGMRLVACVESKESRKLNSALVKELTGGDTLRARQMRTDFFQFSPTHKIILCTNHKPHVPGNDSAMWRRLRLIPFNRKFADDEQNKELPEMLKENAQGIMARLVEGCRKWQCGGLVVPECVSIETRKYQSEEDTIGRFIVECCIVGKNETVKFSELHSKFDQWCADTGENKITKRKMGTELRTRGFQNRQSGVRWYDGISLKVDVIK